MSTISKINGIVIANISKINGIVIANISKVDGISISAAAWFTPTAIHSKCGEAASFPATNTIDGHIATDWEHNVGHEHWIIFDLGETKTVEKIRLYSLGGRFSVCNVSAVYINDTADESGGSKGSGSVPYIDQWTEIDVTDTSGRYIKIKLETRDSEGGGCYNNSWLYYFMEFQAYVS